ncbi:peptidase S8/S53 domain-containing protein [Geopyxis carbonaria]|nr:peptidase S8/S53 domain-containing protein [Geopyxis carbonaria]
MRFYSSWLPALQLISVAASKSPLLRSRDYSNRDYYALELAPDADPTLFVQHFDLEYEGILGELDDHHLFSRPRENSDVIGEYLQKKSRKRDDLGGMILFSEKQRVKTLHKRVPPHERQATGFSSTIKEASQRRNDMAKTLNIQDPSFKDQWHLFNVEEPGHDLNLTGVWLNGITGHNSTVAVVDDGLDMDSPDLKDNYFAAGSYDFNDPGPDPKPRLDDDAHGTRCAGEIAAVKNDVCGVGVAWDAKVAGIRMLSKQISDADEAIALNYGFQDNQIYSCSWGPADDGRSMEAPGILIRKAMIKGIQEGRQGLGSVFVFASGNGAASEDNCNFDGYTNSIYSITVGAIDRKDAHPYYSELCSAQMVVTYSSGAGSSIHTTDIKNRCNGGHGGTSAAAPLAAGVYALVLSVRPDLSWRDMQYLTLQTAVPVDLEDDDWDTTVIGKKFNHKYGYGKLDAYAIVEAAKDFESVKPQAWFHSPTLTLKKAIPEGDKGLKTQIAITKEQLEDANFERVEHVTVKMNAKHGRRGDMSVDLISPKGIVSHIATARSNDDSPAGYRNWEFMTVKHWGEDGVGSWTIVIRDVLKNEFQGSLEDWSITLWGEAKASDKAELYPLPGQTSHHTIGNHLMPTSSAVVVTTSKLSTPTSGIVKVTGNPVDHIHRPVNSKISESTESTSNNATGQAANSTSFTSEETENSSNTGLLPSFLPTFGVSAKTQAWIYGSFVVISAFVALVAIYVVRQRRKERARKDGRNYDFEALNDEDAEEGLMGGQSQGPSNNGRRKARDLYDAFGASDDEEFFSDGDEDVSEKEYEEKEAYSMDEGPRDGPRQALLTRDGGN